MPITKSLLQDLGFNNFNVKESGAVPITSETPLSAINQVIPNTAIDLSKTTLDTFQVNQWMRGGSTAYNTGSGWWIGHDSSNWKFSLRGTSGDYFIFDGVNVSMSGALIAGSIHIPDQTTANSFHTNTTGNSWWGCNVANFNANNDNANAYILNTGVAKFQSVTITGTSNVALGTGDSILKANNTDGIWLGNAVFASAPFSVSLAGAIKGTSGTIGGWTINATSITDVAGTVGLSSAVTAGDDIRFWAGHATPASAPFRITEAGVITASSGTVGGWNLSTTVLRSGATDAASNVLIDSANSLIRLGPTTGDYITVDGANLRIRSSNYVSGFAGAGFTLEPDLLEVGNIACRGLLRTYVLQKDILSVNAGSLVVAPGADVLDADMTALDSSTLTVKGTATFAVGDILRIKDGTNDEWLEVTNIGSAPTYTVTRDKAAAYGANSNPAWTQGASVVNYGQSGDGGLYLTASDTNNPYLSVYTHAGSPWSTLTTQLRIGNLNGYLGYVADIYGFGVGSSSGTNANITIDPTNGVRLRVGTTNKITLDNSGNVDIKGTLSVNEIYVDAFGAEETLFGESISANDALCAISPSNLLLPAYTTSSSIITNGGIVYGGSGANTQQSVAVRFVATGASVTGVTIRLLKIGSPSDNIKVTVYDESSGSPNAAIADGVSNNVAGSSVAITWTNQAFTFAANPATTIGTAYWIVIERTGARDTSNFYIVCPLIEDTGTALPVKTKIYTSSAWTDNYSMAINIDGQNRSFLAKTDANYILSSNFVGFADEAGSAGNTAKKVKVFGVIDGLSGLTANTPVWLSDTAGAVSSTPGTYQIQVGMARSATTLVIDRETKKTVGTIAARTYSSEHTISASGNTDLGGITSTSDLLAQEFVAPGNITIDRIQVRWRYAVGAPSGLTLQIRTDSAGNPDMTAGGLIASVSATPTNGSQTTDSFNIGSCALANGVTYHVVLNGTAGSYGGGKAANVGSDGVTVTVERIKISTDGGVNWVNTGVNSSWYVVLQSSNGASVNVGCPFYPKHVFVDDGGDNYDLDNLFNESGVSSKNAAGFTLTRHASNTKTWLAIG